MMVSTGTLTCTVCWLVKSVSGANPLVGLKPLPRRFLHNGVPPPFELLLKEEEEEGGGRKEGIRREEKKGEVEASPFSCILGCIRY